MAPPACESESQAVEESDARGSKKEAPGVKFDLPGVQFRVLGSLKRASGDLLASWAPGRHQEGALGEKRAVGKLYGGLLGPSWGPLGAS